MHTCARTSTRVRGSRALLLLGPRCASSTCPGQVGLGSTLRDRVQRIRKTCEFCLYLIGLFKEDPRPR
eukprot:5818885-Alexandrium_andersonii.AAC.1